MHRSRLSSLPCSNREPPPPCTAPSPRSWRAWEGCTSTAAAAACHQPKPRAKTRRGPCGHSASDCSRGRPAAHLPRQPSAPHPPCWTPHPTPQPSTSPDPDPPEAQDVSAGMTEHAALGTPGKQGVVGRRGGASCPVLGGSPAPSAALAMACVTVKLCGSGGSPSRRRSTCSSHHSGSPEPPTPSHQPPPQPHARGHMVARSGLSPVWGRKSPCLSFTHSARSLFHPDPACVLERGPSGPCSSRG